MRIEVTKGVINHDGKEYVVGKSFACKKEDGQRLMALGVGKEVDVKKDSSSKNTSNNDGLHTELIEEAKALDVETDDKSFKELKAEMELEE